MRGHSRNFGLFFGLIFLFSGTYLVYGSVVAESSDGFITLIAGSVPCALAILLGVSSIKSRNSLHGLIRHSKQVHRSGAAEELPRIS